MLLVPVCITQYKFILLFRLYTSLNWPTAFGVNWHSVPCIVCLQFLTNYNYFLFEASLEQEKSQFCNYDLYGWGQACKKKDKFKKIFFSTLTREKKTMCMVIMIIKLCTKIRLCNLWSLGQGFRPQGCKYGHLMNMY